MVARIEGRNITDPGFNAFNVRNEQGQYDKKQAATLVKNIKAALDPQQKGINDSLKDIAKKLGENTVAVSEAFQSATEKDKKQFTAVIEAAKAIGKKTGPAAQGAAGRTFRDEAIKLSQSNPKLYESLGIKDAAFKDSGIFKLKSDFKNKEGMFGGDFGKIKNFRKNALTKAKEALGKQFNKGMFGDTGFLGTGTTAATKEANAKRRVAEAQMSKQNLDAVKGLEQAFDTVAGTEMAKEKPDKEKSIGEKSAEKSKDKAAEKASSNSGLDTESTAEKQVEILEDIHTELRKLNEQIEGGAMAGNGGGGGMLDMLGMGGGGGRSGRRGRPGRPGRPGRMGRMFQGVRNFAGRGLSAATRLGGRGLALGAAALGGSGLLSSGVDLAKAGASRVASIGSSALNTVRGAGSRVAGLFTRGGAEVAETAGSRGLAKTASKGLGKSLLKKIPGVGLVAGLGFGAGRLMRGDWKGALGEVASGAASTIPGLGTAASVAIDAGLAARDMGVFGGGPDAPGATRPTTPDAPGTPRRGLFGSKAAKFGMLGLGAAGALAGGKMLFDKFSLGEKISSGRERLSNWWAEEKAARGIDSNRDMRGDITRQDEIMDLNLQGHELLMKRERGEISEEEYNEQNRLLDERQKTLRSEQIGSGLTMVSAAREFEDRTTNITGTDGSRSQRSMSTMEGSTVQNRIIDLPFIDEKTDFGGRLAANVASMLSNEGGQMGAFAAEGIETTDRSSKTRDSIFGQRTSSGSIFKADTYEISVQGTDSEGKHKVERYEVPKYHYMAIQELVKDNKVDEANAYIEQRIKPNFENLDKRFEDEANQLEVPEATATTSADPLVGMYGSELAGMMNEGMAQAERNVLPTGDAVANMTEAAATSSVTAAPVINNITNNTTNPTSKPILLNPQTSRSTDSSLSRFQNNRHLVFNGF